MANTSLIRTPSSTGNRKTFTFSAWFKKASIGAIGNLFSQYAGSGSGADKHFRIRFNTNDTIGVAAFSTDILVTNRVFRDVSSWYHVVLAVDTTQSTEADRVKLYINGDQITDFSSTSYPTQNYDYAVNTASYPIRLGADDSDGNGPYGWFDGCMSHVHLTDGAAYAASTFGSTDATTGEWQINTSPSVTYGTNGFFMFKDDNSLSDDSGQGNNFTLVGGNFTKTEDNPSNNFATLNPLINPDVGNRSTYTNGNTKGNTTSAGHISGISTMAVSEGKYYCESKSGSSGSGHVFGVIQANKNIKGTDPQDFSGLYGVSANGTRYVAGTQTGSWGGSYTYNNVMGLALDMDASPPKLHIHYNGSYSNGSGAYNQTFDNSVPISLGANEMYHFFFGDNTSSGTYDHQVNFGNGYFGTTAISSEGTNASGHGKFEYDVPSGYTALCTKGLNE